MKKEPTGKAAMHVKSGTDWERLHHMSDEEVHTAAVADPDTQPTDEAFWEHAKLVFPEPKETVTIRLDREMLEWFRKQGRGYQTRINAVLCAYVKAKVSHKHQNG